MGLIQEGDVQKLLKDDGLMADIVKSVVDDPATMEGLADDLADELSDELEDDPELKKAIVDAAISSAEFKSRLVKKLAADLND